MIPALNEADEVAPVIAGCRRQGLPVYLVDDGSTDATSERGREAGAEVIVHEVNLGKGKSLEDGIERATADGFDAVVFLDADGQHDPAALPRFVEAAEAGADLVLGCRDFNEKMPFLRRKTNQFQRWLLSRVAGQKLGDTQSGYRLIRTALWPKIRPRAGGFAAESEMLVTAARIGARIVNVSVPTIYVEGRKSRIRPVRDAVLFLLLVVRLLFTRRT
ncbi:MAG: glycosyltransferase family 2 protein [Planctomycetota bacterium]